MVKIASYSGLAERLQVLLDEHLEQALLADPAHVVAGIALTLVEQPKRDAGVVEDARDGPRRRLRALVEGREVADEPHVFDGLLARVRDLEIQPLGPAGAHARGLALRVALAAEVLQRLLQQWVHLALVDQAAAHVDDRQHVLDPDRTGLDARHARRARPQDLVGDQGLGAVAVVVQAIADVEDELPRGQRRTAGGRRAHGGATTALDAREGVEHLLPAQIVERGDADKTRGRRVERGDRRGRLAVDRQRPVHAARRQLAQEHVRDPGDDVEVLRERQQAQEDQDRDVVQPPSDRAVEMVVEQAADDDAEDQDEDQDPFPVRGVAVALLGALEPEQARRVHDQPPVEHVEDAGDHGHRDRVARDRERGDVPRGAPVGVERPAEQRDDLEQQDEEAPEDDGVHDPRRLLAAQELALPEPVDDGPLEALGDPLEAVRRPRAQQQSRAARRRSRRKRGNRSPTRSGRRADS